MIKKFARDSFDAIIGSELTLVKTIKNRLDGRSDCSLDVSSRAFFPSFLALLSQ